MDAALLHRRNVLSMELDAFGLHRVIGSGIESFHNYLHAMKEFIHGLTDPMRNDLEKKLMGFIQDRDANHLVEQTNYMSLKQIEVFVPGGLSSTYLAYVQCLEKSQDAVDGLITDTLAPAIAYFSTLLGAPETMSSVLTPEAQDNVKLHTREIGMAKSEIADCFGNGTNVVRRAFGTVFARNRDWAETTKRLEALTIRLANLSPLAITEKVDELVSLLDRLIIRMQQSPDVYKVNGITGNAIAKIVMGIGEEVEYYASHVHYVQTAAHVMKDNGARLKEILNRK